MLWKGPWKGKPKLQMHIEDVCVYVSLEETSTHHMSNNKDEYICNSYGPVGLQMFPGNRLALCRSFLLTETFCFLLAQSNLSLV